MKQIETCEIYKIQWQKGSELNIEKKGKSASHLFEAAGGKL